jgi:hypothetical protein
MGPIDKKLEKDVKEGKIPEPIEDLRQVELANTLLEFVQAQQEGALPGKREGIRG